MAHPQELNFVGIFLMRYLLVLLSLGQYKLLEMKEIELAKSMAIPANASCLDTSLAFAENH